MAAGVVAGLGGWAASAASAPDAFAAVSGQYNVVDDFGAAADGSTNDRAAIQDAIDAAEGDGGGVVFFPAGVYAVDAATSLTVPDKVRLAGTGPGSVIRCDNENTTADIVLLDPDDGARVLLTDLALEGPTTLGPGGKAQGVLMGGGGGGLRAERCSFSRFSYSLRVSSGSIWLGAVEAVACVFTGYGGGQASMPILLNSQASGGRGRRLSTYNCVFRDFGLDSSNLEHAMYVASDWDVECVGCQFESAAGTGYCVHVYDVNVTAANASRHQKVVGCRFGEGLGDVRGVVSASNAHLLVDGCTFENGAAWVTFNGGGGDVVNCDFVGEIPSANGIVVPNEPATPVTVKNSRFFGKAVKLIYLDATGVFNFEGNTFDPSPNPSYCISVESAATVRIAGNSFLGANNSACVRVSGSGASKVSVEHNRFRGSGGDGVETSNSNAVVEVFGNDFSASSGDSMNFYAMPSQLNAAANHGARSPSRGSAIIAAEESRNSTSYGLMSTPDMVQEIVMPTNGLLYITYQALFKSSVALSGWAAIFIGSEQLKRRRKSSDAPVDHPVPTASANKYLALATIPGGCLSSVTSTGITGSFTSDVTTGQSAGASEGGGACAVFVAAGVYDISVQFKADSGSVSVKERKLWVEACSF